MPGPPDDLIITGKRVLIDGELIPATLTIRTGRIHTIDDSTRPPSARVLDAGNLCILPGLVDTHVHVNEPGRTDWEGFETAGMAAAAGGITTIVVMPLNCTPAATNVPALMGEVEAARGKCRVDHGFWGGIVPGNAHEIEPTWNAGALGFKAFMVDSGVDDFPGSTIHDLEQAAPILARLKAPLLLHAEDPKIIAKSRWHRDLAESPRSYYAYQASRSAQAEIAAIHDVLQLCMKPTLTGLRAHIVHVAEGHCGRSLKDARTSGFRVTGETCPHYLTFAWEQDIVDGATQFKCAPPVRGRENREMLWSALRTDELTMVVSDHSPCPPDLKHLDTGDFSKAWGGISSLQLSLSATWTGARARGFALGDIARWMCENPAKLAGIANRKGRVAPGCDADLIFFDPDAEWTVQASALYHRHKLTPYDGRTLRGRVHTTLLRGRVIYDAALNHPFPTEPLGQWIKRGN